MSTLGLQKVGITEKIEKLYVRLIRFFNSVPDIVGFTDEPALKCEVQVVKNTL